ncbi:PREDICTED: uncharacterized protein LOC104765007 [Camelina sativa]|uniref:Uncharacterized protein LOC104765007 n=1 Tax=Camelina sativa TaxID=90675 RepID=A0ABM0XJM9_CAMSA|nr:PREDICTED: uncharacterized protein LOC104765007 [Camelina sativa]
MAPTVLTGRTYSTHKEYSVDVFGGETLMVTVTPDFNVISQWINDVVRNNCGPYRQPLVVGVGVQWTPPAFYVANPLPSNYYAADPSPGDYVSNTNQRGELLSDPPADSLQLCVGNQCLIIQLRYCDQVPNSLGSFLTDPKTTFVGVWNSQDAGKLARCSHRLEIGKLLDVRPSLVEHHVNDSWGRSMRGSSFEKIVEECMGYRGVRLDPEISRSDWTVYNLGRLQVLHASLDTHFCYRLGVGARLWQV